ncbi:MAG: hypothetical protein JJE25_08730 [Bacteroidia bacterium]|nr:hypothetical protein [Bacteroidia bacterium]
MRKKKNFVEKKESYLIDELLQLTLVAGLATRNEFFTIYDRDKVDLIKPKKLKADIRSFLKEYYHELKVKAISEQEHINKIIRLSDTLSNNYRDILFKKRFRIGVSQKLINLFLKYLWALDKIETPHHCPFDNIIKRKLKNIELEDWTELDSLVHYMRYVTTAKKVAMEDGLSIAEWELTVYKRR